MRVLAVTMRLAAIAAVALLAQACGTTRSEVKIACPPLVQYTPDEQKRAADEYEKMDIASMARRFIDDYGELRARCRAINKRA